MVDKGGRRLPVLPPLPQQEERPLGRFPKWLHRQVPTEPTLWKTKSVLEGNRLATVCEEARCPNLMECWSRKTATFLAMGSQCTRACSFCSIDFSKQPKPLDPEEPHKILQSVRELDLRHVVITMVARDDLPDGGAAHLKQIVSLLKQECPERSIEILTSDFNGDLGVIDDLLTTPPHIFNHNIETCRRCTPEVRHRATYDRSLSILSRAKSFPLYIKSGLMVGLGETHEEVLATLNDLATIGCDIVTIGQYLQASQKNRTVKRFVTPKEFEEYAAYGHACGIPFVYSSPFVRSSYNADAVLDRMRNGLK